MSVLDSIDTTVTIEWQDARTIGTLIELGGRMAILTALRTPEEGAPIHIVVDNEVPDETVAIDGVCRSVAETPWGEQQAEVELLRVGTTCSASKLRDFIEEYGIIRGGSVHIGRNRDNPNRKRFVYHLPQLEDAPEGDTAKERERRTTISGLRRTSPERGAKETVVPPSGPVKRRHAVSFAMDAELVGPAVVGVSQTPTVTGPPRSHPSIRNAMANISRSRRGGFEAGQAGDTHPDFDVLASAMGAAVGLAGPDLGFEGAALRTNPDLGSAAGGGSMADNSELDQALREALDAVEQPRLPARIELEPVPEDDLQEPVEESETSLSMRSGPEGSQPAIEVGGAVLREELDPTQMMDAFVDVAERTGESIKSTAHYGQLDIGSAPEVNEQLRLADDALPGADEEEEEVSEEMIAKIDDAIALERAYTDSEFNDADEPIIVNTVAPDVAFADPVQLGHDNVAPAIAPSRAATRASTRTMERRKAQSGASFDVITDSVARPRIPTGGAKAAAEEDDDEQMGSLTERRPSDSLVRVQHVFGIDMAIRCDLRVTFGAGRSKRPGNLLRLAESKLRIASEHQPGLYERIDVLIPAPDGGKGKITLRCEVTRIREPDDGSSSTAFDMRLAGSNPPKQMQALRELIRSFEAPAA